MPKPTKAKLIPAGQPVEAEQGIISALFQIPGTLDRYSLELIDDTFGHIGNREIFRVLAETLADGIAPDPLAVAASIRAKGLTDTLTGDVKGKHCKGAEYVVAIAFAAYSYAALPEWIEQCTEAARRRALITACHAAERAAIEGQTVDHCVAAMHANLGEIGERKASGSITAKTFAKAKERHKQRTEGGASLGMRTGITAWDVSIGGIYEAEMVVIGARPKVGKTSMIETAIYTLIKAGHPVLVIQKDMSPVVMIERMACRNASEIYEVYVTGHMDRAGMLKVLHELNELEKIAHRLHIYSPRGMTGAELASLIWREKKAHGIKAWFLDHFQTLKNDTKERVDGYTENSEIIRQVINDTEIPGVIIAQLAAAADKGDRPNSGQFKWCDGLFSDCDRSILLWSKIDPKDLQPHHRQEIQFTIDANRMGAPSDNIMMFHREWMQFEAL